MKRTVSRSDSFSIHWVFEMSAYMRPIFCTSLGSNFTGIVMYRTQIITVIKDRVYA